MAQENKYVKVSEAIEEIEKAKLSGDGGTIGQYLEDSRKTVREAAEGALEYVSQNDVEDATPVLEEPEDAQNLTETAEEEQDKKERMDAEGSMPGSFKNAEDSNDPIRVSDWIKMSLEEAKKHEKAGNLVGYNPRLEMGLLK